MEEGITILQLIKRAQEDDLTLEIDYVKEGFPKSTRTISDISESNEYGVGYIRAFCHTRGEERTFKISRIVDARIVPTTQYKPLPNYEFDRSKPIFNLFGEKY